MHAYTSLSLYVRGLSLFALSVILISVEASHFGKSKQKDCNVRLLSGDKASVTEKDNFPLNCYNPYVNVDKGVMYVLWF